VLAIGHEEERVVDGEKILIPVLDKVKEWVPKFDPEAVSKEVVQICKDYKITQVTGDAYGGEWPRDPLKKRGIAYILCEKTRSELYLDFLPVVNSRAASFWTWSTTARRSTSSRTWSGGSAAPAGTRWTIRPAATTTSPTPSPG
jgi:hypothetical protein